MHIRLLLGGFIVFLAACQPKAVPTQNKPVTPETIPLAAPAEEEPTLGTLGSHPIPVSHAQAYWSERQVSDSTGRDSLLRSFIQEYRYYLEAKEMGFEKAVAEEVEAYRDYLSNEFWEDSVSLNSFKKVTLQRYPSEVELSQILITLPVYPTPQDTLEAYRKVTAIKQRLVQKEMTFAEAARLYSQDAKTNTTGGYLGWFGVLQLVYPMEEIAFSKPVGSFQGPIRTSAGYHLLWIQNKRPYSGQVRVRHLLRTDPSEQSKLLLDSLKIAIEKQEISFEEAVQRYSEDLRNKNKGGELASFAVGERMDPLFETQAFGLKNPGELSAPFQTKSGWHLLQLIGKTGFEPSETLDIYLENKLTTDSRGEFLENQRRNRVRKELQWKVRSSVVDSLMALAPPTLVTKTWQNNWPTSVLKKVLFESKNQSILVEEFAQFLMENQAQWQVPGQTSPNMWLKHQVNLFENQVLRRVYTQSMQGQPEFESRIQQHTRDLMSKLLLNDLIWEKSVADTVGQRLLFEKTKDQYWQTGRMEGVVLVADQANYLDMARELMAEEKPYALRRGIAPIYFKKNEMELDEESERRLRGLMGILANQTNYLVEIGGHSDVQEEDSISVGRLQRVSSYLQKLGLDFTRIQEIDFGKTRPVERFDWQKNQRVTFQFLSYSREELAKIIQSKYGNVLVIKEGVFSAGEPWIAEKIPNRVGTYRFTWEDKFYEVIVEKILPPRPKTLREARGQVIKAYQDYLLQDFDRKLAEKYPLSLDASVVPAILTPTHP